MNNAVKMMVVEASSNHSSRDNDKPFESFANILMNGPDFIEYTRVNGYHFTDSLADHATKMMINSDGTKHNWTSKQVKDAMISKGMKDNPHHATWGDASYVANMAYADLFPSPITSEQGCIDAAYKTACDPDGYEGMIFCRWLSDIIAREVEIDWKSMM